MAIDYYVSFPCPVRQKTTDDELLHMEKARDRADRVLRVMRADPGTDRTIPEEDWTFAMEGPGGVPRTERIGDLIQEAAPLKALGQHCKACRANLFNRDFGCGGIINYPIPFEAEEWLVAQLPDDLDSAAGRMLMYAIEDFDYSGQVVDELRVAGDVLESSVPAVRKWSNPPTEEATTVTSSQVIHMMFLVGNPQQANHAKMVAWYLGILEYKGDRTWDYVIDASACTTPENNQAIAQFKDFLKAAAFAGLNDVDLFVDA